MNIVNQRPPSEGPLGEEATIRSIEDLVDLPVDDKEPSKVLKLGKNLSNELREVILAFLK